VQGPFVGHVALYFGMGSRARAEVLLTLLGGQARIVLPKADVEAVCVGTAVTRGVTRERRNRPFARQSGFDHLIGAGEQR
jgi:hypothetical protein